MRLFVLTFMALSVFFFSCRQSEKKGTDVQDMNSQIREEVSRLCGSGRIYTAEWEIHKIVYFSDSVSSFLGIKFNSFGDRKFIVPINAKVKSYTDMGQVGEKDIHIDNEGELTIVLPKPQTEITGTRIDWDAAKSYVSFYRSSFTESEKARLLQQGEQSIREEAAGLNLDAMARQTAEQAIKPLVRQLGFADEKVHIIFTDKVRNEK